MTSTVKTKIKKCILLLAVLAGCFAVAIAGINVFMILYANTYTCTPDEAAAIENADCIMVLGCGVYDDRPTPLLADRLQRGVELYQAGASPKLLMTGDHGRIDYDEVNIMKGYALDAGIKTEDVFMDHAGFSTYESMYRARDVFDVDSIIIVTQEYHLYRAVYNARRLGLDAYGVACDPREYYGQSWMDARELLARCKDYLYCIFRPEPTFLGEVIPISGDGNLTAG